MLAEDLSLYGCRNLSYYNNIRQGITHIKHKMYVYVHCLLIPQDLVSTMLSGANKI